MMITMKMTASVHWYLDNDDEDDRRDDRRDDKEEENKRNSDHDIITMTRQVLLKI